MKSLTQHINEKLVLNSNSKIKKREYNYRPETKDELKNLIVKLINERGNEANLNDINTSKITDMSNLFIGWTRKANPFNGDISEWEVSNVTNMKAMFFHSQFNGDISKWDVSNVKDMNNMFFKSKFNGDISKWDVSNVEDMSGMFESSEFNNDISKWDVSNVRDNSKMFWHCKIKNKFKPKFND